MQEPVQQHGPTELEELRRGVRDLVAISALAAVWARSSPAQILEGLAEVLFDTLRPDMVYVRVQSPEGNLIGEVSRAVAPDAAAQLSELLSRSQLPLSGELPTLLPATDGLPASHDALNLASAPLAYVAGTGTVIVGAARPGFPTEMEQLLLNAGANQAAIALQTAQTAADHQEARAELARLLLQKQDALAAAESARRTAEAAKSAAERALRQLQAMFRDVPAFVAILRGPTHTFEFVNRVYEQAAGRPARDLVGKPARAALPELEGQGYFELLDHVYTTGAPVIGSEGRLLIDRRGDGTLDEAFMNFVYQPIAGEDGATEGIFVLGVEVTEQVTARLRLEELAAQVESERARLEAVLQQMPSGVIIAEAPTGQVLLGNAQVERIWGRSLAPLESFDQYSAYQGFHADGTPYAADEWPLARAIARGETVVGEEIEFLRADGSRGVMQVSAAPIRDREGTVTAGVVIFQDVSEQKYAVDVLRVLAASGQLLAAGLDDDLLPQQVAEVVVPHLADWGLVHLLQDDGRVRLAAVAHAPGAAHFPPEDAVRVQELFARAGAEQEQAAGGLAEVVRSGRPLLAVGPPDSDRAGDEGAVASLLRRLGGSSALVVPLRARGRTLGTLSLVSHRAGRSYSERDVTLAEEVAARAALAIANARLYRDLQEQVEIQTVLNHALRETANARDQAIAGLQQSLRTRDEFLSAVAHDLKTPLTSIKALVQILQRRVARAGAAEPGRFLEALVSIETSVNKMTAMVNELLDLTRIQMDRGLDLELQPVDLVEIVLHVGAQHQQLTDRHRVRVETAVSSLVGQWDAMRLERVLSNLVANAIKYSPDGGEVLIHVARDDSAGAAAVVTVRDEGVGIPPDDLPHLFDRFYRAANVVGQFEGTGIGLTSVRHIVESHGGTVTATSEVGRGSVFTVRLPVMVEGQDAAGTPHPDR